MPQSRYWNLAGQAVAIVASILLAFAIQAWWDESQEKEEAHQLLEVFAIELKDNISLVDQEATFRTAKSASARKILDLASSIDEITVSVVQFDELLNDLTWWGYSNFAVGGLESIIQSGKLSSIESIELRSHIASWNDELECIKQYERIDEETYHFRLLPFLTKHTNLTQISNNSTGTRPGLEPTMLAYKLPVRSSHDHRELMDNEEFLALVTLIVWHQEDFTPAFARFRAFAEQLQELLDVELGRVD